MSNQTVFKVAVKEGDGLNDTALLKKFSHVIGGKKYWFALHFQTKDASGMRVCSHWESGKKMFDLKNGMFYMSDGVNTLREIAKTMIDQLVLKHGVDRVRVIIDSSQAKAA